MLLIFYFFTISMMIMLIKTINFKTNFNKEKASAFECGFFPLKSIKTPFSIQFFKIMLIFLMFDIEIIMILPIPLMLKIKNLIFLWSSLTIILIITLSLLYEWKEGNLKWMK